MPFNCYTNVKSDSHNTCIVLPFCIFYIFIFICEIYTVSHIFISAWRIHVSSSYLDIFSVIYFFGFCLSEKFFISLLFLKNNFTNHKILKWQVGFFFLSALWIYHLSFSCTVSFLLENTRIILWVFPSMWWLNIFSPALFKITSLFDYWQLNHNVSWCSRAL